MDQVSGFEDPRVLLVELDLEFAYTLQDALSQTNEVYDVEIFGSLTEATESARGRRHDLVVVDLQSARARTCAPMLHLLHRVVDAPLLVVSNHGGPQEAMAALEAGADSFVHKQDGVDRLVQSIQVSLARAHSRSRLRAQAFRDPLTGLHNRASFLEVLSRSVALAGPHGRLAVFFADLDGFKQINDRYGHAVGDLVLSKLSAQLQGALPEAHAARLGGDEFALLVEPLDDLDQALEVAETLVAALETPLSVRGQGLVVGGRVGVALRPLSGRSPEALLACADRAMYAAKRSGGTIRVHFPDGTPQWSANAPELLL